MNIMVVTANKNETEAVLSCKSFSHTGERSPDKNDPIFYNVGTWGHYNVTHFELTSQGSIGADSAQLSIAMAINNYNPDAVILVGIAFGKEYHDSENHSQHIGDVLISEKVADYESGKIKDEQLMSDGVIPESGRHLISIFKHYEKTWNHVIDGRKAHCEFGVILSGDKVVDDRDFKAKLLKAYPRAIGGEMEGRGAYAACRNRGINEWIIVKGICDWADGTKGDNKELYQKNAAESAVSLLDHIFSEREALIKLDKNNPKNNIVSDTTGNSNNINGTIINNGVINMTSSEYHASNEVVNTESLNSINAVEPTSEYNVPAESKHELISTRARNDLNGIMDDIKLAKENITIISVNYIFARNCMDILIEATKRGVKVRLIALNPKGKVVPYFTINTNVSEASKVAQILASYSDIRPYLLNNSMIEARFVDTFFSCGCIGIDTNVSCDDTRDTNQSWIFLSPYLYNVGVAQSPVIEFYYPDGINPGNKYAQYIENLWDSAT